MTKEMKNSIKYVAVALSIGTLASCADLDTEYLGGYVNNEQKEGAAEAKPDLAAASVTALYSQPLELGSSYSNTHFDFGYPAIMLGMDMQTADMNGAYSGYNWFRNWQSFGSQGPNSWVTYEFWEPTYANIKMTNDNLAAISPDTEDNKLKFFRAQSLAMRAFDYWILAQVYQFNYKFNPQAPCVPLLTDENSTDAAVNGAPRATCEEVYAQIMKDLDEAISLLDGNPVTPASVITDRPKRMVSAAVAYGLRARVNMSMGKYAEAASDAQNAISKFSGAPASIADVSKPTFVSLNENNWMWGIAVNETDGCVQTGIINWPSHLNTFSDGYTTVGGWRYMSKDLWESIPSTDVRKGWFLDENYTSPNLSAAQQTYIDQYVGTPIYSQAQQAPIFPYTNVKFDSFEGALPATNLCNDIPRMRVEEMYYILAEAQGMSQGVAQGKATLENFVKTYRDPAFASAATTAEQLQEEIFQQKRVELWGEGLMYYEYMRLDKGIDRRRAHAPYVYTFNIPARSPRLIYCLPQEEINSNKAISEADNNEEVTSQPTPVDWEE